MGSGADKNKRKGNIKTLGQKPKDKPAAFDISNKNEVKPKAVAEVEYVGGIEPSYIKDLIVDLEGVREKYQVLFNHADLEICAKTLQRLIDRLKVVGE